MGDAGAGSLARSPPPVRCVGVWPSESAADVVQACTGLTAVPPRTELPVPDRLTLPSRWTRRSLAARAGTVSQETMPHDIAAPTGGYDRETVCKTSQEQLKPTRAQEHALGRRALDRRDK